MTKQELIAILQHRLENFVDSIEDDEDTVGVNVVAEWLVNTGHVTQETMFDVEKSFKETGI